MKEKYEELEFKILNFKKELEKFSYLNFEEIIEMYEDYFEITLKKYQK